MRKHDLVSDQVDTNRPIGHIQSQKQARSFNLDSDEEDICMAQTNKFTQS